MTTDKGKPNPSVKHALDEVLKNLQDLVRNELADEAAVPKKTPKPRDKTTSAPPTIKAASENQPETATIPTLTERILPPASKTKSARSSAPPGGLQEELPLDLADPPLPAANSAKAPAAGTAPTTPDDIPVLKDMVVVPTPAPADTSNADRLAAALAARFNAALRESGKPALDPAMIDHLEDLVREALEAWANPDARPR